MYDEHMIYIWLILSSLQAWAGDLPEYEVSKVPASEFSRRTVTIPSGNLTGLAFPELVHYDPEVALQPLRAYELTRQEDWLIAVRLLLSEMGIRRLANSKFGLLEAIGILETVSNRMDPDAWNPEGVARLKGWPGCTGPDARFATCANAEQYLGLDKPRSLRPPRIDHQEVRLMQALDVAVMAWWLHTTHLVEDLTLGATSYVHRCGATAYGMPTRYCDRQGPTPDVPGAKATTGPIAFKGPGSFLRQKGFYTLRIRRMIDYEPSDMPPNIADLATWFLPEAEWAEDDFITSAQELDAVWSGSDTGAP